MNPQRAAAADTGPTAGVTESPQPTSYGSFISSTIFSLADDTAWPDLGAHLQDLHLHAVPIDPQSPIIGEGSAGGPQDDSENPVEQAAVYRDQAVQEAIECTDSDNPGNAADWPRYAASADEQTAFVGATFAYNNIACTTWPTRDDDRYSGLFTAAARALIVGTRFDPATPYRSAEKLTASMPTSRLISLEGFGHAAFGKSACITTAVAAYLLTAQLPISDPKCPPDRQPFDPISSQEESS